ncbi:MAG: glycosyltransferase [Chlorobi bacterium]|nr:glycosyltransferase [Chlorobiota bacterium]
MEEKVGKKIKVCFFSPASYPFFDTDSKAAYGGAELQMFLLAKVLSLNSDSEICFLIGNYKVKDVKNKYNIKLISSINLKQKESIFLKIFKSLKYFFCLTRLTPDLLISTNANAVAGISAFYCKVFKKKFIYRTSSLIDVNQEYTKNNGLSGKLYQYGLRKATKVITQNKEHQFLLKKNYNIDAVVLKNIFEVKEPENTNKEFILWVSRYHKLKRPDLFLKLAEHFTEKNFVMICPYNDSNKVDWQKLKEEANKISNLKFIEKIPFREIQEYFNKAKLFINTSDFEGFPNTFLQAAQGKTPVVSLNVNPDNFITEYNCGIFAEGNLEKLLSETEKLLQNKADLKIKGDNLFRYLQENHDIKIVGKQFKQFIESVL